MKSGSKPQILTAIKFIHTIIWAFLASTVLYVLYAAIVDRIGRLFWIAVILIVLEGLVLLVNGWRCPLTTIGAKYADETPIGFDIYLPTKLAKHNKLIFTTLFLLGLVIAVFRSIT